MAAQVHPSQFMIRESGGAFRLFYGEVRETMRADDYAYTGALISVVVARAVLQWRRYRRFAQILDVDTRQNTNTAAPDERHNSQSEVCLLCMTTCIITPGPLVVSQLYNENVRYFGKIFQGWQKCFFFLVALTKSDR